jgi:hypothetical protein
MLFTAAMIAAMVERQLHGHLERNLTDQGLVFVIRLPGEIEDAKP